MDSTGSVTSVVFWHQFFSVTFSVTTTPSISAMAKKNKPLRKKKHADRHASAPVETRGSESLTVFWVVTVLTVMLTNVLAIAAHFYQLANPDAELIALLKGLMLFSGSLVGLVSLVVLPILYRVRQSRPPRGLAVFGACAAAAPILALLVQSLS